MKKIFFSYVKHGKRGSTMELFKTTSIPSSEYSIVQLLHSKGFQSLVQIFGFLTDTLAHSRTFFGNV